MIIKRYCAHCHLGTYVTAPTRWVLLKVRYDSTKILRVSCKSAGSLLQKLQSVLVRYAIHC
jgi:hypothetical protein